MNHVIRLGVKISLNHELNNKELRRLLKEDPKSINDVRMALRARLVGQFMKTIQNQYVVAMEKVESEFDSEWERIVKQIGGTDNAKM